MLRHHKIILTDIYKRSYFSPFLVFWLKISSYLGQQTLISAAYWLLLLHRNGGECPTDGFKEAADGLSVFIHFSNIQLQTLLSQNLLLISSAGFWLWNRLSVLLLSVFFINKHLRVLLCRIKLFKLCKRTLWKGSRHISALSLFFQVWLGPQSTSMAYFLPSLCWTLYSQP